MDSFQLNKENYEKIQDLEKLHSYFYQNSIKIIESRNPNSIQHQLLFISMVRIIKYIDSYLILVKKGYGEPANCILRSIFEGILWMRWSVMSRENAMIYFDSGKTELNNMVVNLIHEGLIPCIYDKEELKTKIKKRYINVSFPSWKKMARDVGLINFYKTVYPMLSAMSHGSYIFFGERINEKKLSTEPDNKNILPFLGIANILYTDAFKLLEQFILENKIYPLTEYEYFLKLKKFTKK